MDQACHSQHRILAQLQRVAKAVVLAAHDYVYGQQASQGLEIGAVVANRQVTAFDQRKAKIAGQEGMLEEGLVVRPRGQQHDARIVAPHEVAQHVAVSLEENREAAHMRRAEDVGQYAR